jgi:hypothetical protein
MEQYLVLVYQLHDRHELSQPISSRLIKIIHEHMT